MARLMASRRLQGRHTRWRSSLAATAAPLRLWHAGPAAQLTPRTLARRKHRRLRTDESLVHTSVVAFRRTYRIVKGPPAMPWDEQYESQLRAEWQALLESTVYEKALQQFLERHPCLVTGSRYPMTSSFPVRAALIAQPGLHSTTRRVPDFMWLSNDSATLYPVLIEIERPGKHWFTSKAVPTAKFTQAMSRVASLV